MNKKLLAVLTGILMIGLLAACQGTTPAVSPNPQIRQISVSGTGKVYLVPDIAYIYIGVRSQSENVATSLNDNNLQAKKISDTLKERGVAAEDIQTTSFNVYPQQQYTPDGQLGEMLYVVENTVYVKVRDLQNLGNLLDAVVRAGANSINGITFDVEDRTAAEAEARKLAVEDAKSRAVELAGLAGVELGDLYNISVYSSGGISPVYEAKGGYAMDASATIAAGQMLIQVDASLTYEIR